MDKSQQQLHEQQHNQGVEMPSHPQAEIQRSPPPPLYDTQANHQGAGGAPFAAAKDMPYYPQGQPPQQQSQQQVPHVVPLHLLSEGPQWIDCPFCQRRTQTRVGKEGTPMQILAGVLCCLLCVCLACVPCLAGWCEDVNYYCSGCGKKVAMRPADSPIQVYGPQHPGQGTVPSQFPHGAPPQQPAQYK